MKTRIHSNLLVTYDDRVVGEVVYGPIGFVYHHYRFGSRHSSALPTLELLLPKIDEYLTKLFVVNKTPQFPWQR